MAGGGFVAVWFGDVWVLFELFGRGTCLDGAVPPPALVLGVEY